MDRGGLSLNLVKSKEFEKIFQRLKKREISLHMVFFETFIT